MYPYFFISYLFIFNMTIWDTRLGFDPTAVVICSLVVGVLHTSLYVYYFLGTNFRIGMTHFIWALLSCYPIWTFISGHRIILEFGFDTVSLSSSDNRIFLRNMLVLNLKSSSEMSLIYFKWLAYSLRGQYLTQSLFRLVSIHGRLCP